MAAQDDQNLCISGMFIAPDKAFFSAKKYFLISLQKHTLLVAGLGGSVGCVVRLETRRSRVQPPPRSAPFFRGN